MYDSGKVADRIKLLAKARGMAASIVLEHCGLNKNALSTMISRGSMPKSENIAKIADYLDCSVDYLLGRTEVKEVATQSAENLPSDEVELLARYRSLDDDGKLAVRGSLLREWRRVSAEAEKGAAIGKQSSAV